ncbi:type III-A CRISPR-associated RAMP protein Csm4 [Aggregatilinea lenta]|uniref:type III-A CRISPR-associated RAMP protein Csm4 n=1 Tax=Aggregatilinea lenta TaxID=913108 RepID=UPI000E5BC2D2|nr:type III-A CRISPR-associated RAMP protein Csm4 [Aggregatilinea lenta]
MQLDIYHLQARSAFHFGQRGVGIEESADCGPSDTLFSAMCHALRLATSVNDLEAMLDRFAAGEPPFLLSGAFPYVSLSDRYLRFYPVPVGFLRGDYGTTAQTPESKTRGVTLGKASKAHWLSEDLFFAWLEGSLSPSRVMNETSLLPGHVLVTSEQKAELHKQFKKNVTADEELRLWHVYEVPRVAVDRTSSAPNIFQAGRLSFLPRGGLWCGIYHRDPEQWSTAWTEEVLRHVGDLGLGGERSSGHGQFDLKSGVSLVMPDLSQGERFMTLSHYHPVYDQYRDERGVLGLEAAYELVIRRGWMSSPDDSGLRRKPVRMIATGSVLRTLEPSQIYGELVDVTPDAFAPRIHTVWRYGFALPVGVRN